MRISDWSSDVCSSDLELAHSSSSCTFLNTSFCCRNSFILSSRNARAPFSCAVTNTNQCVSKGVEHAKQCPLNHHIVPLSIVALVASISLRCWLHPAERPVLAFALLELHCATKPFVRSEEHTY